MPNIYDPFFTTKNTTAKKGSGLGLSIVHAVVEDHQGFVDVSTEVGKGTEFYLYFPITREVIESAESSSLTGGTESLLIIDDDNLQRDVSQKILKKLNYKVTSVSSGENALKYLKENKADLLILDMIMPPGMDGAETYQKALEINPGQKAIIVSGYAETERVKLAISLGAGGFIKKPLTKKAIASAIRNELDREAVN
jgi:CheY-like chemotaxis protein